MPTCRFDPIPFLFMISSTCIWNALITSSYVLAPSRGNALVTASYSLAPSRGSRVLITARSQSPPTAGLLPMNPGNGGVPSVPDGSREEIGSPLQYAYRQVPSTTPCRIGAHPSCQPWRVVPRSVVVEPALLIPLLARVAIPLRRLGLAAHRLIRRAAVGGVLLVGNDLRLVVQLQDWPSRGGCRTGSG